MTTSLAASGGETKVEGVTLKLAGQSQAEMSAAMTKVSGQGKLGLESSGMAELQGRDDHRGRLAREAGVRVR